MIFDRKIKRGMEVMNERNRRYLDSMNESGQDDVTSENGAQTSDQELAQALERQKEYHRQNDDMSLEKGDIPAMIISAFIVFAPIILVLAALLALAWVLLS